MSPRQEKDGDLIRHQKIETGKTPVDRAATDYGHVRDACLQRRGFCPAVIVPDGTCESNHKSYGGHPKTKLTLGRGGVDQNSS